MSTSAAPAPPPASALPRLAFAGLGWIGRHRMNAVADARLAEIAYLCDPIDDTTLSFDELLASDADAIVIATPSAMHAEQAIAALERGKAVFCQKPLGRNAEETRRVVDAARANDRLLGVDLSYRFTDAMRAVRKLVADGAIGEVYAADLVFHNAYGPDKPWFYDATLSGGGCVIDLGIHLVDLALWTLGFPRVERTAARLFHHGGHAVEDYAVALMDLTSGAAMQLACSWNVSAGRDAVIGATFYGTDGAAAFHNVGGSFYDFVAEHHQKTRTTRLTEPGDAWGGGAIVDWTRRLAASRAFDPEIEHVVDVAAALDSIYEAGRR
ncbi:MAG: Gfo/Idh/MocA family oxidoreductase [Acidobacteria bacterium]|nr:Gfo/Idh/MocA family oxidoreductase [Acidobacteriota bacterium]MBV9477001.1 Gfo/Idh/MocA family oxidoreductase [Acidobacteriota bacterium]